MMQASLLGNALFSTFEIDWQKEADYMSPVSFLYLADRLLFMTSSSRSYFFTTKSSFSEALGLSGTISCFGTHVHVEVFFIKSFNCLAWMIQQILFDKHGTIEWIMKSGQNERQYYPLLVLKLVVMLGIVCLNSRMHLEMLKDVLSSTDIVSVLPKEFCSFKYREEEGKFQDNFATALVTTNDPLLLVSVTGDAPKFVSQNVCLVDMSMKPCRQELLDIVFSIDQLISEQNQNNKSEPTASSDAVNSSGCSVRAFDSELSSDLNCSDSKNSDIRITSVGCDLLCSYDHLCASIVAFLEDKEGKNKCSIVDPKLKMEVEALLSLLDTQNYSLNKSLDDADQSLINELRVLIDELEQFSVMVNTMKGEIPNGILKDLMDKLQKKRQMVEKYSNYMMENKVNCTNVDIPAATSVSEKNNCGKKDVSGKKKHQVNNRKKGKKGRR